MQLEEVAGREGMDAMYLPNGYFVLYTKCSWSFGIIPQEEKKKVENQQIILEKIINKMKN